MFMVSYCHSAFNISYRKFCYLLTILLASLFSACSVQINNDINKQVFFIKAGDNLNDELTAIFKFNKSNITIQLEQGLYFLDKQIELNDLKGISIMGNNATIIMRENSPVGNGYGMISFKNCSEIGVENLTFDANRSSRACREVAAHTFMIVSSNNFNLSKVSCINNVVDGFIIYSETPEKYESYSWNIKFKNCESLNSFRNGLSIINGNKIVGEFCKFSGSNGTAPESGLVIESDIDRNFSCFKDISFDKCEFIANKGWGVLVSQKCNPTDIKISNSLVRHSGSGGIWNCSVKTTISGNVFNYNGDVAIRSVRYESRSNDTLKVDNNLIKNEKIGVDYLGIGAVISENVFDSISHFGIQLNGLTKDSTHATITNNSFSNCASSCIKINRFRSCDILNNGFFGFSKNGISITSSKARIESNKYIDLESGLNINYSEVVFIKNVFNQCVKDVVKGERATLLE